MICELCGKKTEKTYRVIVEGAELLVCDSCKKFGREAKTKEGEQNAKIDQKKQIKDIVETVIENYHEILKEYRERNNLTQEEMAKKLGIKLSLYKSIEEGRVVPDISLAKKIEKILKIKLVQADVLYSDEKQENKKYDLTVGDVLNVKFE